MMGEPLEQKKSERALNYSPALDGIRAIAVLSVLLGHFSSNYFLGALVGFGDWGVMLFFVLSGFLITKILLFQKGQASSLASKLKTFYVRRSLRIFPIYYLTLVTLMIVGYEPVVTNLPRLLTYTANFLPPWQPKAASLGAASHLWSLSVEEQFYLMWPLLIFICPKRRLLLMVFSITYIAFMAKLFQAFWTESPNYHALFRHVYSCIDALGIGAVLALLRTNHHPFLLSLFRMASRTCLLCFPAIATLRIFIGIDPWYNNYLHIGVIICFVINLSSAALIDLAFDSKNIVAQILQTKVLVWIGKISYGIYLYHFFLFLPFNQAVQYFEIQLPDTLKIAVLSSSSILVATVSWYLIERPILSLKDRFYGYAARSIW